MVPPKKNKAHPYVSDRSLRRVSSHKRLFASSVSQTTFQVSFLSVASANAKRRRAIRARREGLRDSASTVSCSRPSAPQALAPGSRGTAARGDCGLRTSFGSSFSFARSVSLLAPSVHPAASQHHRHRPDVAPDTRMSDPLSSCVLPCPCTGDGTANRRGWVKKSKPRSWRSHRRARSAHG